jgi:benzylsuccinate CoA-transferase BbsF subunit
MSKSIFAGIKVADFTTAIAGPLATRFLAGEGATVVKIECHQHPDPVRLVPPYKDSIPGFDRSTQFPFYNYSKYSISLDINMPMGQGVARRLVKWADIVIENMAPCSMEKWALTYEDCCKIKSDIIYLSSSSLGRSGPLSSYAAWGYHHGPLVGFSNMIGWPDRLPCVDSIAYTDSIAPSFSVIALVGALLYRKRTGKGVYIDQSQTEAGAYFLGPAIMDSLVNNRIAKRSGNRDPYMAPHGVFPCKGEDRWVAIAISNQNEWESFCQALDKKQWLIDERFTTISDRKTNEDELERLISEWTAQLNPEKVVSLLQSVGVPSGIVATCEDLFKDPQLKHRRHFGQAEHKEIGIYSYERPPFRFSKNPPQPQRPGPLLGEHNQIVLQEFLGYSEDEISDLLIEGVITTEEDWPDIASY